jgi:hypothetical protein
MGTEYDRWLDTFTSWLARPHSDVRPFPPADPCPVCGLQRWWLSVAHNWICEFCHPPEQERCVVSRFRVGGEEGGEKDGGKDGENGYEVTVHDS